MKFSDNLYYIVPNKLKESILEKISLIDNIYDIHFDTLDEFMEKYICKIKKEAIVYLLELGDSLDIINSYLKLLPSIDINKEYNSKKLNFLKERKQLLIDNNLFIDINDYTYLTDKEIIVMGYPFLDNYLLDIFKKLNARVIIGEEKCNIKEVYEYKTKKEEITALALRIRDLNKNNIPYSNIYIAGVDDDSKFLIEDIFKDFDIPYQEESISFLTTITGKKYLNSKDNTIIKDVDLLKRIIKIEEDLSCFEDSKYYDLLLENELEKVKVPCKKEIDSVKFLEEVFEVPYLLSDDDCLFLISLVQNKYPKIYKDDDYLSDKQKKSLGLITSMEKNKNSKYAFLYSLSTVKNFTCSYALSTLQDEWLASSIFSEYNVVTKYDDTYQDKYSDKYNRKYLGELLDNYYMYGEKGKDLDLLFSSYHFFDYETYEHDFTSFNIPKEELVLSYSSIDDYALCPFKYYLKYVLKLDEFEESFSQKLGIVYHAVLSSSYKDNFDFEKSFTYQKNKLEWDSKEEYFISKLKDELKLVIDWNKEMEFHSGLTMPLLEKRIELQLSDDIKIKGFIDKILLREKDGKTYYAIFDYKTGRISFNLDYLDYGLHLQLPIYAYLLEKSNQDKKMKLAGLFYQMLLVKNDDIEERKKSLKVFGIVNDDMSTLELLDEEYEKSNWIKNLSVTKQGTLSRYLKTITEEEKQEMFERIEKTILSFARGIRTCNYSISPKIENKINISCMYCPFASVCYHEKKDEVIIEKKEEEVKTDA